MDAQTKRLVRTRAGGCCEYCRLDEASSPLASLQIEHIRPKKHHGDDGLENLALACIDCNLHKGPNVAGIDPLSSQLTALFHPRLHVWEEHFEILEGRVHGRTAIGRVTIDVLNFNSAEQVLLRLAKG